jgi:colanic acid/amylovoran biosynthesis glycosyltransferase
MTESTSEKRVALFRTNFLPYSETFIHDELRHHSRYEATVFARQWRNADSFPGHQVVAIEKIPSDRHHLASAWFALTTQSSLFDAAIQKKRFDILHAHFGHNGTYAIPYAKRYGIPLVVSLHGRDVTMLLGRDKYKPQYWHYLFRYRRLFREASLFLAASTELKDLITGIGCPTDKVIVNRLGIDLDMFTPKPDARQITPPILVMVGRFVEKKGHEYGIKALALARDAGYPSKLFILGDGPLQGRYNRLIETLNLRDLVEFPGPVSHAQVCELMLRSTVVLAPSVVAKNLDRESGLIVAKEAAACGIPTIGTLHGGIPDIIDDGITGYLVPERDAKTLGDRLIKLLSNEDLRLSMGAAARQKMKREYNISERILDLEDTYDNVIAGKY